MNKTNKVACFYTQLKDNKGTIEFTNDSFPLIEYWEKSWKANGWETYVLGEDDIIKDEYYSNLKFDNFKESNLCKYTVDWDCEYSRACYLRWLAYYQFAKKHGDIFWADYDVINYGLSPHLRVKVNTALSGCNSVGKLNKDGGRKILDAFVSVEKEKYQINTLHKSQKVSDMFIARAFEVFDVHQPLLCRSANERILTRTHPFLINYHGGIFSKPDTDSPWQIDYSDLLHKKNGTKYSRVESIAILEKQYGLQDYDY